MSHLKKLFEPIKIGQLELENRIVFLAMGTQFSKYHSIPDRLIRFNAERARGGAGLVIAPFSVIDQNYHKPDEHPYYGSRFPGIYNDDFMPDLRRFADAVHAHSGAKTAVQLLFMDVWAKDKHSELEFVSASAVAKPHKPVPRELTIDEIGQIVEVYGDAARRAREVGFDAVEIYAGMGFMLNQFLSSYTNKRTDKYGGAPEDRARIVLEIVANIKRKAGQDYPISCRISGEDLIKGGNTLEDTTRIAVALQEAGIHILNAQAGWLESPVPIINMAVPRGAYVYVAEAMKGVLDIPVAAAYRINDPLLADQILVEGKADLIGMCRGLVADPDLPNKAKEGRFDDIRRCIACNYCIDLVHNEPSLPVACAINPLAGHEGEYTIEPTKTPKKVFVIGGGPAGMEAASIAAQRGHSVTLFDRQGRLGGQLLAAAVPPHKDEIAGFIDYLAGQVATSGVGVKLSEEADADAIVSAGPDVVVLATGAVPLIPDIPGTEKPHVVTAVDVLRGRAQVGQRVLIVGGGLVGCETALSLSEEGKQVTILEMLNSIGADIGISNKWLVLMQLAEAGIVTRPKCKVIRITDSGIDISHDNTVESLEGDTVVLAAGMKPDTGLIEKLQGKVTSLYTAGDCVQPRRLWSAIEEGFNVARQIE